MTNEAKLEAKLEAAQNAYAKFRKLQGEYFQQSANYACALGAGTATEAQRIRLVAAKEAYYAA